jgi:hypothetical protein
VFTAWRVTREVEEGMERGGAGFGVIRMIEKCNGVCLLFEVVSWVLHLFVFMGDILSY